MDGPERTVLKYDAVSKMMEDVPSLVSIVLQRVYASDHFGSSEKKQNSSSLVPGREGTKSFIYEQRSRALQAKISDIWRRKRICFLMYIECTLHLDSREPWLICVSLRYSTEIEIEYTTKQPNAHVASTHSVGQWSAFEPDQYRQGEMLYMHCSPAYNWNLYFSACLTISLILQQWFFKATKSSDHPASSPNHLKRCRSVWLTKNIPLIKVLCKKPSWDLFVDSSAQKRLPVSNCSRYSYDLTLVKRTFFLMEIFSLMILKSMHCSRHAKLWVLSIWKLCTSIHVLHSNCCASHCRVGHLVFW